MKKTAYLFVMLSMALALGSCAQRRVDLSEKNIRVDKTGVDGFSIALVNVYERNGSTVISGRVRGPHGEMFVGHVDAAIETPAGEEILHKSSRPIKRTHRNESRVEYAFHFHLDGGLPAGSVISLTLHDPGKDNIFDCEDNRAEP